MSASDDEKMSASGYELMSESDGDDKDVLILYEDQIRLEKLPMAKTGVFWSVDDFPVPKEDIVLFANNIKKSLKKAGFLSDDVSINAYGQTEPDEITKHHYNDAGITFASRVSKRDRLYKMLSDLLLWEGLAERSVGPTNVLLITKGVFAVDDFRDLFSEKEEFEDLKGSDFVYYILHLFELGPPNIHFVVPDYFDPDKLPYLARYPTVSMFNCVWYWNCLLRGDKPLVCVGTYPLPRCRRSRPDDDNDDDYPTISQKETEKQISLCL